MTKSVAYIKNQLVLFTAQNAIKIPHSYETPCNQLTSVIGKWEKKTYLWV